MVSTARNILLSIRVSSGQAVAGLSTFNQTMRRTGQAASGMSLPFIGGISLLGLLGVSSINAAESMGLLGDQSFRIEDSMFRLQAAIGGALAPALDLMALGLEGLTERITDSDGSLNAWGYALGAGVIGLLTYGRAVSVTTGLLRGLTTAFTIARVASLALLASPAAPFVLGGLALAGAAGVGYLAYRNTQGGGRSERQFPPPPSVGAATGAIPGRVPFSPSVIERGQVEQSNYEFQSGRYDWGGINTGEWLR